METSSKNPSRCSKNVSFSSEDLMCKLPKNPITRIVGFSWKKGSCVTSRMGFRPRSGPGFARSWKDFRSSGGMSWASLVMSNRNSVPREPVFAVPKTNAMRVAAPQRSMPMVGAVASSRYGGGSGHPRMWGQQFLRCPIRACASAPLRQRSNAPSLYSPFDVTKMEAGPIRPWAKPLWWTKPRASKASKSPHTAGFLSSASVACRQSRGVTSSVTM
mmetsp:Transcript_13912/g.30719  ORF Transcript_13912/g.30719 Transcript_13912/m.30719 type:complete len:216 (-) Transcript_13912:327-974(-)